MTDDAFANGGNQLQYKKKIIPSDHHRSRINIFDRWRNVQTSFSFTEKIILYFFVALLVLSTMGLLHTLNNQLQVIVPAPGGEIVEGIVGTPRFINPVLEISDADRDLTALIYTGLMHATPEGRLIPSLAERFTISDDGLTYTFILKDNVLFHDGTPITAEDVAFTIALAQNPDVKSPKRANWEGVRVTVIDERTIQFILGQIYAPFLENTTMGILPKHQWEKVPPEQLIFSTYNTKPIGAGPFAIADIQRNKAGVPEKYTLERFNEFILGIPYLERIHIRFYPNEDELLTAFGRNKIENINSISPEQLTSVIDEKSTIHTTTLPRVFGVFINQDKTSLLTSHSVREALTKGIDRGRIVEEVLGGYGSPVSGPLPPDLTRSLFGEKNQILESIDADYATARTLLEDAGWELNEETNVLRKNTENETVELRFSLATSNVPELKRTAEILRDEWKKLGVAVDLEFYETSTLNQEIIRPREYQTLLFGQIVGRDLDPFAFWHSSQRNDPGLNIALYANIDADAALENIRSTFTQDELVAEYQQFAEEIAVDVPAVFLYSPEFIYITNEKLKGVVRGTITTPAERFLNVHEWHIYTQKVWTIFEN